MQRNFVVTRFIPALGQLAVGVAASGATLAHYRGNAFDLVLVGALVYLAGFLIATLLAAAVIWGIGQLVVGSMGRLHLQYAWVIVALGLQLLLAALSTYDLYGLGVFKDLLSSGPKILILLIPYAATYGAFTTLFKKENGVPGEVFRAVDTPSQDATPLVTQRHGEPKRSALNGAAWGAAMGVATFLLFAAISMGDPSSQISFTLGAFTFFVVAGALLGAWGLRR